MPVVRVSVRARVKVRVRARARVKVRVRFSVRCLRLGADARDGERGGGEAARVGQRLGGEEERVALLGQRGVRREGAAQRGGGGRSEQRGAQRVAQQPAQPSPRVVARLAVTRGHRRRQQLGLELLELPHAEQRAPARLEELGLG